MNVAQLTLQLTVLLTVATNGFPSAAQQPNIIILLADDLGYGELGCQGNQEIPTPHIDSIAQCGRLELQYGSSTLAT